MTNPNFRKKHIGGSDIPIILGLSPWSGVLQLWAEKIEQVEPSPPNEYMKRGIALEPEAREAYMQFTGKLVSPVEDMESKTHSFCSASLDGWTPSMDLIVEIKCPTGKKTLTLAKEGKIEAHYYAQVQWQLFVSGAKMANFWVWHPKDGYALMEIEPNEEFQKLELDCAKKFWESVTSGFSPDPNYLAQEIKDSLSKVAIVAKEGYIEIEANKKKVDKWLEVERTLSEMEMVRKELEVQKKDLERELLEETDGGSCILNGKIKVCSVEATKIVDWKRAQADLGWTDELLKPYLKDKKGYSKFSLLQKET